MLVCISIARPFLVSAPASVSFRAGGVFKFVPAEQREQGAQHILKLDLACELPDLSSQGLLQILRRLPALRGRGWCKQI